MTDAVFNRSKYTRWYLAIAEHARLNPPLGYSENHHVIPKKCGGSDSASNMVRLSAKQHFVAHHLLTKMMVSTVDRRKMITALWFLCNGHQKEKYAPTARAYSSAKEQFAE